jgi:mutator protein MutT
MKRDTRDASGEIERLARQEQSVYPNQMQPLHLFRRCPTCAAAIPTVTNPLVCPTCQFTFFFNPTVAAAAFIRNDRHEYLFVRRAKEPAKGKLGLPGGFIDIGESAEQALHREVREEVGIEIADVAYLCSCPNEYHYRGVTYPVCDLIFTATAVNPKAVQSLDGVAGYEWRALADTSEDELAFPSMKLGLKTLRGGG